MPRTGALIVAISVTSGRLTLSIYGRWTMTTRAAASRAGPGRGASRAGGRHFAGDLRRALLDAAGAPLDGVGAAGLSLRGSARRAGVSHAAPAHHFTDKAGLLTAVAAEGFSMLVTYLADAQPGGAERPVDQLPALGRAYAQFAEENPGRFEVMFRPGLLHADDQAFQRAGDAAFQALRHHIATCQRRGWREHEPTDALAAPGPPAPPPPAPTHPLGAAASSCPSGPQPPRSPGTTPPAANPESKDADLVALAGESPAPHDEPMTLTLRSPAFEPGAPIPARFDHERGDLSPALAWDGVPEGTAGLVLLADDPDAPVEGSFVHWVLFNLH